MLNTRNQVGPEIENNTVSSMSTSSDQLHMNTLPGLTTIAWKEMIEQHRPRRRSLDNMLDNNIVRDQWNKEEIVRETMSQVNLKISFILLTSLDFRLSANTRIGIHIRDLILITSISFQIGHVIGGVAVCVVLIIENVIFYNH
jgi:hypothetical protein